MIATCVLVFTLASFFWLILNFIFSSHFYSIVSIGSAWCVYFLMNSFFWIGLFFLCDPVIKISLFTWVDPIRFHIFLDHFSIVMEILVALISFSVMIFSLGYVKAQDHTSFFRLVGFFSISMQSLLMSGDLLSLLFFWEMIGAASFLLIGFFHTKESLDNSFKVFIFNRLGDACFIYALAKIYMHYHSFDFSVLQIQSLEDLALFTPLLIAIFMKSAQWPFHIWLPLSMSAPTPVSALLHAATLVTSGVYLYSRIYFLNPALWDLSFFNQCVLFLGSCTIILGGFIAIFENHIKVLIAYSTISQIGYALVAVGLGMGSLSYYHLWTHGFFKALLFLCAAFATHQRNSFMLNDLRGVFFQDRLMKSIFFIALLSLIGCPPFAGFYSKERIIHAALTHEGVPLFVRFSLLFGALQTAIYSARLGVVFCSESLIKTPIHSGTEDLIMKRSLIFLSLCTLLSGPLGESMGFLAADAQRGWSFIEESVETGWVILFISVFWVVFRVFKNVSQWLGMQSYQQSFFVHLSKECYWPEKFFQVMQVSYANTAKWVYMFQHTVFESGIGLIMISALKNIFACCEKNLVSLSFMVGLRMGILMSFCLLYGGIFLC